MATEVTPGRPSVRLTISRMSWARNGQPAVVRATVIADRAVVGDGGGPGHAELDDVGPELGVDHAAEGVEDVVGSRNGGHERILTASPV